MGANPNRPLTKLLELVDHTKVFFGVRSVGPLWEAKKLVGIGKISQEFSKKLVPELPKNSCHSFRIQVLELLLFNFLEDNIDV